MKWKWVPVESKSSWTIPTEIRSSCLSRQDRSLCWTALHKKSRSRSSLCNLFVLCVSVVDELRAKTHHRDTEDTEVAQRNPGTRTFSAKPCWTISRRGLGGDLLWLSE